MVDRSRVDGPGMNGDAGRFRRLSFLECIAALHVALVGLVLKLGGWTTTCFSRFDVGRQRNRAEGNRPVVYPPILAPIDDVTTGLNILVEHHQLLVAPLNINHASIVGLFMTNIESSKSYDISESPQSLAKREK
jgi:hypothetical protein